LPSPDNPTYQHTRPRVIPSLPPMNEKTWLGQVVDLARLRKWKVYHTHNSMHSPSGFPDLVLCRPPRLIFAELKTDRKGSHTTVDQEEWLAVLRLCAYYRGAGSGVEVFLWRPSDFDDVREVLW
jgi:hypothetical protein